MAQTCRAGIFSMNLEFNLNLNHDLNFLKIFDARVRIISALILAISISRLNFNFNNLILITLIALPLLWPVPKILLHLNIAGLLMLLLMTLSFANFKSGFQAGLIMILKLNFISIIFLKFIAAMGIKKIHAALYYLRLNNKLRVLIILTLRGIFILVNRFVCALRAASLRARNIKGLRLRLKIFACVLASALVQSVKLSDRINIAINLRGGLGGFNQAEKLSWRTCDNLLIIFALTYAIILNYV
ncbi:MAG: hypothetical protein II948_04445 [Synergistaceae bacterium]|nr:hypothetical protein [Synergistaceae bacterium]MBQ9581165.1 hypothetical protein [Synergistaceae bacterium]MBR0097897.1 hypothetical protein [Synergistaceae bacterium]